MEIRFAGKTTDFADELLAKAENYGFELTITDSYPGRLNVKAKYVK